MGKLLEQTVAVVESLFHFSILQIKLGYSELEMEDSESVEIRMQYTDLHAV